MLWCRFAVGAGAAAVAVLAAGCGGSHGHPVAVQASQSLAFSRCMRSHSVPNFADPNSSGALPKETPQQLGVSSLRLQSAETACRRLLPNGGGPTPAALRQSWSDFRTFAVCMRRHGVPNWPEPTRYPLHPERPTFELQAVGIDPSASQVTTEIRECEPLLRGNNPQHLGEG